jgi:hypothetical protein
MSFASPFVFPAGRAVTALVVFAVAGLAQTGPAVQEFAALDY